MMKEEKILAKKLILVTKTPNIIKILFKGQQKPFDREKKMKKFIFIIYLVNHVSHRLIAFECGDNIR